MVQSYRRVVVLMFNIFSLAFDDVNVVAIQVSWLASENVGYAWTNDGL